MIQASSGKVPFHDVPAPAVPVSIICGKRPPRPSHPKLTDALWELAERCWTATARDRPEMEEVVKTLKEMLVSFLVYVKKLGLIHPHRNTGKTAQVKKRPSTRRKLSDYVTPQKGSGDGGGDVAIPYDVGNPTHKVIQTIGGGTTNEPPQRPLPGSMGGVVIEHKSLKKGGDTRGFKGKDVGGLKEKLEVFCDPSLPTQRYPDSSEKEKERKDVGPKNHGKGNGHVFKTEKDEKAPKPTESTTTAPVQTKDTHGPPPTTRETPPDSSDEDITPSTFLHGSPRYQEINQSPPVRPQANPPGGQTLELPGVQLCKPPAQSRADNPRNHGKLAGQDH